MRWFKPVLILFLMAFRLSSLAYAEPEQEKRLSRKEMFFFGSGEGLPLLPIERLKQMKPQVFASWRVFGARPFEEDLSPALKFYLQTNPALYKIYLEWKLEFLHERPSYRNQIIASATKYSLAYSEIIVASHDLNTFLEKISAYYRPGRPNNFSDLWAGLAREIARRLINLNPDEQDVRSVLLALTRKPGLIQASAADEFLSVLLPFRQFGLSSWKQFLRYSSSPEKRKEFLKWIKKDRSPPKISLKQKCETAFNQLYLHFIISGFSYLPMF